MCVCIQSGTTSSHQNMSYRRRRSTDHPNPSKAGSHQENRGIKEESYTSSQRAQRLLEQRPQEQSVRPLKAVDRGQRPPRQADDIPVFDRNKVSLDFPGSLFGPSVSLLIKTTKIVGDVVQNTAVRYQSFLRLFRPLFKGPFEIKGLDPPTTTTTTTTKAPPTADNEVRRR